MNKETFNEIISEGRNKLQLEAFKKEVSELFYMSNMPGSARSFWNYSYASRHIIKDFGIKPTPKLEFFTIG